MSYRDNLTDLFAASLCCGFEKEASQMVNTLSASDEMIKLAAGYTITNLSHDGIVKFVGDLVDRELQGLIEEKPPCAINLRAFSQSEMGMGIENAKGDVSILLPNDVELQIPFAISKGELIPFDVIQLGEERCPYTRENLAKIMMNIINKTKDAGSASDGYVSVEPRQNATTTSGFLTNMLQVRSRGSVIPDAGGMFVTASEKRFENVMDKIAELKPFDWEQVEKVASIIADRDREKMIKRFSDLGAQSAEMVKTAAHKSAISKSQPWKKLSEIEHGTFVRIPEMKDSSSKLYQPEFSMTPAYVIRKFNENMFYSSDTSGKENNRYNGAHMLIITNDHRFMVVPVTSSIICLESGEPLFKLKGKRLKSLENSGEVVLFKTMTDYTVPLRVGSIDSMSVDGLYPYSTRENIYDHSYNGGIEGRHPKTKKDQHVVAYNTSVKLRKLHLNDISSLSYPQNIYYSGEKELMPHSSRSVEVYLSPNVGGKIRRYETKDVINELAKAQGTTSDTMKFLVGGANEYFIADEEQKCICLAGTLGKTFKNYQEIEDYMGLPFEKRAGEDFCGLYKQASTNETVTVTKMNGAFNLSVRYVEKDGDNELVRDEKLTGLNENGIMGALLGFGFDESIAKNMVIRASNSGSVSNNLPLGHNTKNIFGGKSKKIKKVIEKIKNNKMANFAVKYATARGIVKGVVCATSKILEHTSLPTNERVINLVMGKLASDISESKSLSIEFEKKAVEHESVGYRKIAKALATSAYFHEAATRALECPENYPHIDKIAAEVINIKRDIEDVVTDIMMEKMAAYKDKSFNLNPSYYTRAVYQLNDMYELATEMIDI